MEVAIVSGPTVTCCNGGSPFVDVARWTPRWSHFVSDNGPDGDTCQTFRVQFYDQKTFGNYRKMNATLSCKCETDYYGSQCQLKRQQDSSSFESSGSGSGNGSNFKMSLFLAVVPLSFAVFAAVGGLLCKMFPCCICFDFEWPKNCLGFGKKLSRSQDNNSADYDDDTDDYDSHNHHSRNLHNIQVDVHSVDLVPVDGGGGDWNLVSSDRGVSDTSRSPLHFGAEPMDAGHFSDPNGGFMRNDVTVINHTVPLLPDDPPPPFSPTNHAHTPHCCNCRKYSPPPPYSEIAQSSNSFGQLS